MATSFRYNVKYKAAKERTLEQYNFDGGLITDKHESKLQPNQSPNMENVIPTDTNTIKTRNGYLRYNGDPIGSSSDEANTGASTGTITIDDSTDYVGQTFQVGTGADLVQVDFYLAMNTSGEEQYMKAELWSGDTGPDTKIADGQILLVSGDSETEYSFRFNLPYTLNSSTEYAVVLRPHLVSSSTSINTVLVHRTGDDYANGAAYSSTDSGVTWSAVSSVDLKFNVYTGTTAGTGLIRYYNDSGAEQLFAKFGTSLYKGNDQTGALTAVTFGSGISLDSTNFIDHTIVNGTLLLVDHSNKIQKYNGSTNANYNSGTISVTVNDATVTGSGTSWNTSTNAEVGEYIKLPDSKWYKIASISSDTSLEIEIPYKGSTLAGQTYVISPWGEVQGKLNTSTAPASLVRPTPKFIESHVNRVWTLDGNTLRFSALDTSVTEEHFNDWDTSNNAGQINIPSGNGDTGTGLYSLNNALYVFQRRAIWRLYGTSPATFELRNVTNEIGMVDKRTLVEYNDILVFLSDYGIILFDGTNIRNVSENRINTSIDTWATKTSAAAVLWGRKYLIAYMPNGDTFNTEAFYYDLQEDKFGKFTQMYVNDWVVWSGGNDNNEIYFTSSNQGVVYKWDTGGHDDGFAIPSLYDTPSLNMGSSMLDKNVIKTYLQQIAVGDWSMTASLLTDLGANSYSEDINLSAGDVSLWDVMLWDTDNWSSEGALIRNRIYEFKNMANLFKLRFEQTGYNQGYEILGVHFMVKERRLS